MGNDWLGRMPQYSYVPEARSTIDRPTRAFVFAPLYPRINSATGLPKSDAQEFQICARRFCETHGLPAPFLFDNDGNDAIEVIDRPGRSPWRGHVDDNVGLRERREEILLALHRTPGPIDCFAYFGHGGRNSLSSAGFRRADMGRLAAAIAAKAAPRVVVVLNACNCGAPGGIAERLHAALRSRGVSATVYGHEGSAHTVSNPVKRVYPGGAHVVAPGDAVWGRWRQQLRARTAEQPLFAWYPFIEPGELHAELAEPHRTGWRERSRRVRGRFI